MMMPSSGRDWYTVSGTSPVPGGISMNMTLTSFHSTSDQNCLTVSPMMGPRQTTGSFSRSSKRLMLHHLDAGAGGYGIDGVFRTHRLFF